MVGEPLVIIDSAAFYVVLKINIESLIFSFMSDVLFPVVNESLLDSVGEDEVDDSDYVNDVNLINPDDYTYVFTFKVNGINPSQARDGYEKNMKRYVKFVNLLKRELDNFTDIYEFSNIVFYSYSYDSLNDYKSRTIHTYDNTVNVYSSDVYFRGYRIGDYDKNYKNPDLRGGFAYERIIGFKFGVIKDYQFTNIPQFFRFFTRLFDIVNIVLKNVWPKAVLTVFREDNLKMYFSYEDIENFKKRDVKVLNKLIKPFRELTGKNLKNQLIVYMNYYAGKNISDNMVTLIKRLKLDNKRFKYNIDYENKLFVVDYGSDNSRYYLCNLDKMKKYVEEAMFKETGIHGFGVKMNNFPYVKLTDMNRLDDIKEFCNIFGTEFLYVYFYFNECAFKASTNKLSIDTGIKARYLAPFVECYSDSNVRKCELPVLVYESTYDNKITSRKIGIISHK